MTWKCELNTRFAGSDAAGPVRSIRTGMLVADLGLGTDDLGRVPTVGGGMSYSSLSVT